MGGNALKETHTRRYDKAEFFQLWENKIKPALKALFPEARFQLTTAYGAKETFGDMDIMIDGDAIPHDWQQQVEDAFQPHETFVNSPESENRNWEPFSFDVDEFQIDMIPLKGECYDFACKYYSYNDLGNLIGGIFRKMNVKMGQQGLVFPMRKNGFKTSSNVVITLDFDEALRLGGYDPERFHKGFETMEECFEYATSSRFFNPEIYLLENRNHKGRIRDRKRANYRGFLDYCEKNKSTINHYQFPDTPSVWLGYFLNNTEGFRDRLEADLALFEYEKEARSKFNGHLVMEETGLEGELLGEFFEFFRRDFNDTPEFYDYVHKHSVEELREAVRRDFKIFKKKA